MRRIDLEHGAEAAAGNREDTREDTVVTVAEDTVVLRRILLCSGGFCSIAEDTVV